MSNEQGATGKQLISLLQTRKAQTDRRGSSNNTGAGGCPAIIAAAMENDCTQIEQLLSEQKTKGTPYLFLILHSNS